MAAKASLGILSVVITLIAYARYIKKTAQGKIRPHPLSWFLWGMVTFVAYLVQKSHGAGPGSWVVLYTWVFCFLISIGSYWKYKWYFEKSELWFLGAGLGAVIYYYTVRDPLWSAVLATTADVVGYYSTIKRGLVEPYSDDDIAFLLNGVKFFVALPALESYSAATWLYPTVIGIMNLAVFGMLRVQRWRHGVSSPGC